MTHNAEKLRRLCWEVADLLDQEDAGRFEYVTVRGAKTAGRAAVLMGFDVPLFPEIESGPAAADTSDPVLDLIERYQRAETEYDAHPGDDLEGCERLRNQHTVMMNAITATTSVPASQEGALAALRQALLEEKQSNIGDRTLTIALLEIGLSYFGRSA